MKFTRDEPLKRVSFRISKEDLDQFLELASIEKMTISQFVRQLIQKTIKKEKI